MFADTMVDCGLLYTLADLTVYESAYLDQQLHNIKDTVIQIIVPPSPSPAKLPLDLPDAEPATPVVEQQQSSAAADEGTVSCLLNGSAEVAM